ncbi:hypothetical protein RZS08_43395, partial [Arthrospira platensis SPKY1]|nr:hypothetical protein [Arthrospira platensis SPKY1]
MFTSDVERAANLGRHILARFVPAEFSCSTSRQPHCADVVVTLGADSDYAIVKASYNMPWLFP